MGTLSLALSYYLTDTAFKILLRPQFLKKHINANPIMYIKSQQVSINKMVKLPYILLGYIKTLTLAPCKRINTQQLRNHRKVGEKINYFYVLKITIDLGGRFDLNLARTIPLLP